MTSIEYQTLIFHPNLFKDKDDFRRFCKIREEGWKGGLKKLLKLYEEYELYEYCAIIKEELDNNE
jgi:hypothetical protein